MSFEWQGQQSQSDIIVTEEKKSSWKCIQKDWKPIAP